MKKCLITGAAGQIGIKLLNELIKSQKYEITAVDLKSNKSLKRFANYETKVNLNYKKWYMLNFVCAEHIM